MMNGSKGTKMPRGDKTQILDYPIPNFEINTQNQIAKALSDLDAKIELNNKINAELEGMAKLIYDYWFVQFEFPDKNGKPYKSSGGKMVYNAELKREIPEGWEVNRFENFAAFKNGKGIHKSNFKKNGLYSVYGSNGVIAKTDNYLFDDPVIAIGRVGANYGEVRYSINYCWVSDNAVTVQPLNDSYYWWLLESLRIVNYSNIAGGSAQPLITQGKLKALKIASAPQKIYNDFHEIVNPLYLKLESNIKQNQELSSLRDWLLPMLMNGQVSVKGAYEKMEEVELGVAAEGDKI